MTDPHPDHLRLLSLARASLLARDNRALWQFNRHKHNFRHFVSCEPEGATLGWDAKPAVCYTTKKRCDCGKVLTKRGMLLPWVKEKTDADGWPLDASGNRMSVAEI